MGMPMYGQSFTLSRYKTRYFSRYLIHICDLSAEKNGLNSRTYGGGTAGQYTRARGFLAYYEICDRIQNKGWKVIKKTAGLCLCQVRTSALFNFYCPQGCMFNSIFVKLSLNFRKCMFCCIVQCQRRIFV